MPLRDHFQPPLILEVNWASVHHAWASEIVRRLNTQILPRRYRAQAEVIVLLERSTPTPAERIAAFEELQRRLNLDAATAAKWIEDIRAERESFGPRS